jgi:UTP--glucose-1-phosphate uridylyltransferase
LSPLVFEHLANLQPGAGGEIQLTDALARLIADEPVLAYLFNGTRYDCGSKIGYLQATVALALRHPEVGAEFEQFLRTVR